MSDSYNGLIEILGGSRVNKNEHLKNYTSIKIGGPAGLFFKAQTSKDLIAAVTAARKEKVEFFILGGGTNVIFQDRGFPGLVIKNETGNIKLKAMSGRRDPANKSSLVKKVYLEVDSGVTVNRLVRTTVDQGLSGLENFLGQPGTVGGALWINAHNVKSGKFFGDLVASARILTPEGVIHEVPARYFRFSYDFSQIQKTGDIVLSATLELETGEKDKLWWSAKNSLLYRQKTQPSGVSSAGCLFRNIAKSDALRIATPKYTCSAGYLLDSAGLKGLTFGGLKLSDHHANFLINTGSASAADVIKLIYHAKSEVKRKFGVDLKTEVVIVGSKNL